MQQRLSSLLCAALALAGTACCADAVSVTIKNSCSYTVQLYDNRAEQALSPGASTSRSLYNGFVGIFRNGRGDAANLAEFSVDAGSGRPWYDISIIPPGPRNCGSLADCKRATGKVGFNVPMQIQPVNNIGRDTCQTLTCMWDGCPDGYAFPADNSKTHNCPPGTDFVVTFCPGGSGGNNNTPAPPPPTPAPTPAPTPTPTTPSPTTPSPTPTTASPTTAATTTAPSVEVNSTSSSASSRSQAGENEDGTVDGLAASSSNSVAGDTEETTGVSSADPPPSTTTSEPTPPPTQSEEAVRANTQSSPGSSNGVGLAIALALGAIAVVAGVIILVVRHKKKLLEESEPKEPPMYTPSRGNDGHMVFQSPINAL